MKSVSAVWACHLCPRSYTRAFNLQNHLLIHDNLRPFACTVCRMLFNRNHDRKTHEKLHSGEKKFVCKGCGRRFARSSNLKRHLRSEKGQRCCRLMPDEETVRSDVTTDPKITEIHGQEHNRNQSSTSSSSSEQSLAEHRAANTLTDIARAVPEAVEQHQSSVTGRLGTTSAMTLLPLDFPS